MKDTNIGRGRAEAKRGAAAEVAENAESKETVSKRREQGKHARGFFVGLGIVAGTVFGVPFGFATANPNIIWAGLTIGTALGTVYEQKYNRGLSALTQ